MIGWKKTLRFALPGTVLLALAGCAAPVVVGLGPRLGASQEDELRARDFAPAAAILSGFDPLRREIVWQPGDRLLFGLRAEDGDRAVVRFGLLTALTPRLRNTRAVLVETGGAPFAPHEGPDGALVVWHGFSPSDSADRRVAVPERQVTRFRVGEGGTTVTIVGGDYVLIAADSFDEQARHVDTRFLLVKSAILERGFYAGAAQFAELIEQYGLPGPDGWALDERERGPMLAKAMQFIAAGLDFGTLIWECRGARPALRVVLPQPNFFSLLLTLRCKIEMSFAAGAGAESGGPWPESAALRPIIRLPLLLSANRQDPVRCDLLVGHTLAPLHLSGGVIGADVMKLAEPHRRLHVRLLAARFGPGEEQNRLLQPPAPDDQH